MSLEKDRLRYIIDNELLLREGNDCKASCNNRKYEIYYLRRFPSFSSIDGIFNCNFEFKDAYLKMHKGMWEKRKEIE